MTKRTIGNCDICGILLDDVWGNNAWPIIPDGKCCNTCNKDVILARAKVELTRNKVKDIEKRRDLIIKQRKDVGEELRKAKEKLIAIDPYLWN